MHVDSIWFSLTGKQLKLAEICTEKSFLGIVAVQEDHKFVGYTLSSSCVETVDTRLWKGIPNVIQISNWSIFCIIMVSLQQLDSTILLLL